MKTALSIIAILGVTAGAYYFFKYNPSPAASMSLVYKDRLVVETPLKDAVITSPLRVAGKANWYFEGSFPVVLVDWDGKIIANGVGTAQSDWMTEALVPFEATLTFTVPTGGPEADRGTLIFKADNPSGLPENEDSYEVPVRFR